MTDSSIFIILNKLNDPFQFSSVFNVLKKILSDPTLRSSTRHKRMIGGRNSTIEEFPYAVLFALKEFPICGGAILSPYFIITAAHCVENKNLSDIRIRAGSSSFRLDDHVTEHKVRNFTISPGRVKIERIFDLAILQLVEPIVLNNVTKKSIQMFDRGEEIKSGTTATVMGWGCLDENDTDPDQLQSMNITILDRKDCPSLLYNEICSSGVNTENKVPGICGGDSGSPVVIGGKLAAVVSSNAKGSVYTPNIFGVISKHRDWIDKIVKL